MDQILGILWYTLLIIPALFWFFLIKEFNKKTHSKLPAAIYSIIYIVPFVGHCYISWSFLNNLKEKQAELHTKFTTPILNIYLIKFVIPYILMVSGLFIFTTLGILSILIPIIGGFLSDLLLWIAVITPYISFIWLSWEFWSIHKILKAIPDSPKPIVPTI